MFVAALLWLAAMPDPARAAGRILELRFDWSSYRSAAPGLDNWPIAWCEDDQQYTSWGDGGGFGGTNTEGRVSLGFARLAGSYPAFSGQNLRGGFQPLAPASFGGKVQTLICVDGRLYGWHSPGTETGAFLYQQLIVSGDKGLSWQRDAFPQTRMNGCRLPRAALHAELWPQSRAEPGRLRLHLHWIAVWDLNLWTVQIPGVVWLIAPPPPARPPPIRPPGNGSPASMQPAARAGATSRRACRSSRTPMA